MIDLSKCITHYDCCQIDVLIEGNNTRVASDSMNQHKLKEKHSSIKFDKVSYTKFLYYGIPEFVIFKENKKSVEAGKLITVEDREVGSVDYKVYAKWAVAAGGMCVAICIVLSYICSELISLSASWWLSYWSENRSKGSPWYYLGNFLFVIFIFVINS